MPNSPMLAGWQQRWNQSLLRFLGRRVRSPVDIEDLAQETYLRLLRARDLGEVRNPQAYLLRVASHVLVEWRDQAPRPESLVEMDDDLLIDDCAPEFELEASISQERLNRTLAAASPIRGPNRVESSLGSAGPVGISEARPRPSPPFLRCAWVMPVPLFR